MLAMLLAGPKHGYQLKREAGWMMRQEDLQNNVVYPMLRRFLNEGWVGRKAVPGDRGQTRQQYNLTPEGRRYFFGRMNTFTGTDASSAEAFHLRVGVLMALSPESRESIFTQREKYLQARDQKLEFLQFNMEVGKFGGEIVRHMRRQIDLEQEWIRRLRRMARAPGARGKTAAPIANAPIAKKRIAGSKNRQSRKRSG